MDLLEIRKKAKGLKDAVPEGAPGAGGPEPDGQSAAAGDDKPARKKKARAKRSASKKAVSEAPVAPVSIIDEPPDAAAGEPSASSGPETGLEDEVEYLAFMLAGEEYAVRVDDVKEIIRPQKTTMVPRTPGFVVGIISLRGVILPVFDMKKRLGFEDTGRAKTARVVVVSDGGSPLGILVDRVTGVARLKTTEVEPPPAVIGGVESEYLHGVGRQGDRLLILMNTQRVLEMEGR